MKINTGDASVSDASSGYYTLAKKNRAFAPGGLLDLALGRPTPAQVQDAGEYSATITSTTNGGRTWTVLFQEQGAFEFNSIDCSATDSTHCCAAGNGFSSPSPASTEPGARIHCTTDGGKTWPRTFWAPEGGGPNNQQPVTISQVKFLDDQHIWAVGGFLVQGGGAVFVYSADGGQTWVYQATTVSGIAYGFDMVSTTVGFATVLNTGGSVPSFGIAAYSTHGPPPRPTPPPGRTHYGDPNTGPCLPDEIAVSITGLAGKVCSPDCSGQQPCPTDVPPGTGAATPECVLEANGSQTPTNCVLICPPLKKGICPPHATCKAIQGTGLCTYNS